MPRPRERMEGRISSWFKNLEESKKTERREKHPPFVTISRECGAYGTTIADMLAEHLGKHERRREVSWAVFDKELIQEVMKEDHDRQAYIKRYFQKDISDVSLYDLVINTDTVSWQDAVMIIGDMVLRTEMKHAI